MDLQTRFQRIDTHVVGSFLSIMKMYEEGKKSVKEVHEEVASFLVGYFVLRFFFVLSLIRLYNTSCRSMIFSIIMKI